MINTTSQNLDVIHALATEALETYIVDLEMSLIRKATSKNINLKWFFSCQKCAAQ